MTAGGDANMPQGRAARPKCRATAFTLIELMLVVIIMAMLMTIAVPGIARMYNTAKRHSSLASIRILQSACSAYADDFSHEWPPSRAGAYSGWAGAQLLPLFLTGYAGDDNGDGRADNSGLDEDDGLSDYGFRLVRAGRVYGPYAGAEQVRTAQFTPGPRPVFVDAFGNPIFYYVFRGGQFHAGDNNTGGLRGPLSQYSNYAKTSANRYFRTDFILVSTGPDGRFTSFTSSSTTDDVTNFLEED